MKPSARWRRALVCRGCGADAGEAWAPDSVRRSSRENCARRRLAQAQEHAACDRCRGVDRAARKAQRRAELAPRRTAPANFPRLPLRQLELLPRTRQLAMI